MCAQSADLQGGDGELEIILRACRRGEVHDGIQGAFDVQVVADVVVDEAEALVPEQMGHIVHGPRDQVVHAHHLVAHPEQAVAEMASQKARAAGNQHAHDPVTFLKDAEQPHPCDCERSVCHCERP